MAPSAGQNPNRNDAKTSLCWHSNDASPNEPLRTREKGGMSHCLKTRDTRETSHCRVAAAAASILGIGAVGGLAVMALELHCEEGPTATPGCMDAGGAKS
ncbi:MAG: hypothetical protein FRX49_02258 [Trebouxia sp. A1-2]|nr:MAG: hypothetical protein FRX49_02258 [Trebouxia sp. A1-2]